jgi:hypothetical protein
MPPIVLRGERNRSCPHERLTLSGEHRQVGVKLNAREAMDAEWSEAIVVLEASEFPLDGGATPVRFAHST